MTVMVFLFYWEVNHFGNIIYKLSEGALPGVVEAVRLAAQPFGLWWEASPSAEADSMGSFISTYSVQPQLFF